MRKTPTEMYIHDMVMIDTRVFEIVGKGRLFKSHPSPPPPRIVNFLKYAGSDRVKEVSMCNTIINYIC